VVKHYRNMIVRRNTDTVLREKAQVLLLTTGFGKLLGGKQDWAKNVLFSFVTARERVWRGQKEGRMRMFTLEKGVTEEGCRGRERKILFVL